METVYIETTVVSYLVANRSRNALVAAHQRVTEEWWQVRRPLFACVVSREVLVEAARGNPDQATRRLAALHELRVVEAHDDAERLAGEFLTTGALPSDAVSDAAHLAIATSVGADYLLTWNCRHLANAQILRRLEHEAVRRGWRLPQVCTPLELMGD